MVLAVSHWPRTAFHPNAFCVGFMVHRVALGQVFLGQTGGKVWTGLN
jgi:hypothetical protein